MWHAPEDRRSLSSLVLFQCSRKHWILCVSLCKQGNYMERSLTLRTFFHFLLLFSWNLSSQGSSLKEHLEFFSRTNKIPNKEPRIPWSSSEDHLAFSQEQNIVPYVLKLQLGSHTHAKPCENFEVLIISTMSCMLLPEKKKPKQLPELGPKLEHTVTEGMK